MQIIKYYILVATLDLYFYKKNQYFICVIAI